MFRLKFFLSLFLLGFMLQSCEVCSDCTWTRYEAVCTCEAYDGTTFSSEPQTVQQYELVDLQESCEAAYNCEFNSTPLIREDEICGKKDEVEGTTGDLRRSGWDCTEAAR